MRFVVVDIDGTVAKVGDRLRYLEAKDWDSFYDHCDEDEPIIPIIDMVQLLAQRHDITFVTGRSERVRGKTEEWLDRWFPDISYTLRMRKVGDHAPDTIIKPYLIESIRDRVELILEDRNSMAAKYRELGYTCLQVAEGDF